MQYLHELAEQLHNIQQEQDRSSTIQDQKGEEDGKRGAGGSSHPSRPRRSTQSFRGQTLPGIEIPARQRCGNDPARARGW